MTTSASSYYQVLEDFRDHDQYRFGFSNAVNDLAGEVKNFSSVKSCLSFGTGCGARELEFARRLLPNLREFIAVEPDHDSVEVLQKCFGAGSQFPDVKVTFMETTLQAFGGIDHPVDMVMLFGCLAHTCAADRRVLFDNLTSRWLKPNGIVVLTEDESSEVSGLLRVLKILGREIHSYQEVEAGLVAKGLRLIFTRKITGPGDFSDASDATVQLIQLIHPLASKDQVRAAIAEAYKDPKMRIFNKRLSIFQK